MKKLIFSIIALSVAFVANAQTKINELPTIYLKDDLSVHFISPEPIEYVDISSHDIAGDIPVDNILRIKAIKDSLLNEWELSPLNRDLGVLTIVGESYMAQYNIVFRPNSQVGYATRIEISPNHMKDLDNPDVSMTTNEMHTFALSALKRKRSYHSVSSKAYGITANLNNIYTVGDYVFVDVEFKNSTKLKYDIDQIRFKIEDKKITKATNVQSVEVEPEYMLYTSDSFQSKFRNVYVFKKFTFPGNKIFNIEMSEEQISGRTITLQLDYSDLLNADTL